LESFGITPDSNIQILEPVGYFEMIWLLFNCSCVITDSGGLQKEAFFFKKPCITVREETEWVELIHNNVNFLTGSDKDKIIDTFNHINEVPIDFSMNLYGQGDTGRLILEELVNFRI
jgi:UDP-GlcNAc3NAcA epimerase